MGAMNWWFARKKTEVHMEAVTQAVEFLPFRFQVEEVMEICPEYEMLAHHFTMLVGRIIEGTIKINQRIAVPLKNGEVRVSYTLLLSNYHKMKDEISAHNGGHVEISLWGCSIRYDEIEPGGIVGWCNSEPGDDSAMRLRTNPSLYLHRTKETHSVCRLCVSPLFRIPQCSIILAELTSHPDLDIAQMAKIALDRFNSL